MKYLVTTLFLFIAFCCSSQFIKSGQWRGVISYDSAEVPFIFEVGYPSGDSPEITILNGSDRRVIKNVEIKDDSIIVPLDPFDVEIRASFSAMGMSGVYNKYYRDLSIPFKADFGRTRMKKNSVRPFAPIEERWSITFSPETPGMSKGVGLFKQQGHIVSGTIMTEVSDYRFFEGILDGDSMKLSCFDGAHAFAFLGKRSPEGWSGEMIYDNEKSKDKEDKNN